MFGNQYVREKETVQEAPVYGDLTQLTAKERESANNISLAHKVVEVYPDGFAINEVELPDGSSEIIAYSLAPIYGKLGVLVFTQYGVFESTFWEMRQERFLEGLRGKDFLKALSDHGMNLQNMLLKARKISQDPSDTGFFDVKAQGWLGKTRPAYMQQLSKLPRGGMFYGLASDVIYKMSGVLPTEKEFFDSLGIEYPVERF